MFDCSAAIETELLVQIETFAINMTVAVTAASLRRCTEKVEDYVFIVLVEKGRSSAFLGGELGRVLKLIPLSQIYILFSLVLSFSGSNKHLFCNSVFKYTEWPEYPPFHEVCCKYIILTCWGEVI